MSFTQNIIFGLLGIMGTLVGGEMVVRNAKEIAKSLKISQFFIGLTVLSIGTSLPEIFTHILSSIRIVFFHENINLLSGIAIGTNVGSNIIQITLIAGLSGLIGTIYTTKQFLKRDYVIMLIGIFVLWIFSLNHFISQWEGMFLSTIYIVYIYYLYQKEEVKEKIERNNHHALNKKKNTLRMIKLCLGLGVLIFCANIVLNSATFLAQYWQISGSLIGALILGIATALPEFTTSIISLLKKSSGLSLGTLVGSNITNPLLALGFGAAISGYTVDDALLWYDFPFWFITSFIIMLCFWRGLRLKRTEAPYLIIFYFLYVGFRLYYFL
jgi:cation:H+ antiporter